MRQSGISLRRECSVDQCESTNFVPSFFFSSVSQTEKKTQNQKSNFKVDEVTLLDQMQKSESMKAHTDSFVEQKNTYLFAALKIKRKGSNGVV